MNFFYKFANSVSETTLEQLIKGSIGSFHLATLADSILTDSIRIQANYNEKSTSTFSKESLNLMGQDILLAAFETDCLNTELAKNLQLLNTINPFLSEKIFPLLNYLQSLKMPTNLTYFTKLLNQSPNDNSDKLFYYLTDQLRSSLTKKTNDTVFWLIQSYKLSLLNAKPDWLSEILFPKGLDSTYKHTLNYQIPLELLAFIAANLAFSQKDFATSCENFKLAYSITKCINLKNRMAECFLYLGEKKESKEIWKKSLVQRPWQVNIILKLYDLETGLRDKLAFPDGKGAILFYTWNKAELLNNALKSVFKSTHNNIPIFILDNGSTDHSQEILKNYQNKWRSDNFKIIKLPINIGAAAARNWLSSLPEINSLDWFVYLDDDVLVEQDWLLKFGTVMLAYPQANIYGCKVVDANNSLRFQSVDLHLDPENETEKTQDETKNFDLKRNFQVSMLHNQELDFGDFDYIRPCASVTGCCHLFKAKAFFKLGGFDLRFSPSQYDDLERDLRSCLNKDLPVYQGHLKILHAKKTGKNIDSKSDISNSLCNLMKLQTKYTKEQFLEIRSFDKEENLFDLIKKTKKLNLQTE